jgi:hypothetical protein
MDRVSLPEGTAPIKTGPSHRAKTHRITEEAHGFSRGRNPTHHGRWNLPVAVSRVVTDPEGAFTTTVSLGSLR